MTGRESGRRTPETSQDEKLPQLNQKSGAGRRRNARKVKATNNVKLQAIETPEDTKAADISSNQEDSTPSRKQSGKPSLDQIALLLQPNGPEQGSNNTSGNTLADVPLQLLQGARVDLRRWSVIVSDRTLRRIAAHNHRITRSNRKAQKLQGLLPGQRESSFLLRKEEVEELSCSYLDARNQTTECLLLTGAETITDAGLASIALAVPNLKELAIAGAVRITDAALRVVGESCPNLERLDVSALCGMRGAGLAALVDHCGASLTHLSLTDCPQLGDWVLRRCLYASPKLTHLNLSRCPSSGRRVDRNTSSAVSAVA